MIYTQRNANNDEIHLGGLIEVLFFLYHLAARYVKISLANSSPDKTKHD